MDNRLQRSYEEKSFGEVLNVPNVQYEVPFFQRGYVWGNEKWKELIQEVVLQEICGSPEPSMGMAWRQLLEQALEEADEKDVENSNYYFGTIYLKKKRDSSAIAPGMPSRFLIIDGQQRLITIYLFLIKLYYDLDRQDHYRRLIEPYREKLFNDSNQAKAKLYTLKQDEEALIDTIAGNRLTGRHALGQIPEFDNHWYRNNIFPISAKAKYRLFLILSHSLKITVITLSENDDEMLIFENLNDKGTPLRGDELLCNYLFQPIIRDNGHSEEKIRDIHREYWLDPYQQIQQMIIESKGKGIKQDEKYLFFLRTVLSIGRSIMIGRDKDIYHTFKRDNRTPDSKTMIDELKNIKKHVILFEKAIRPRQHNTMNRELQDVLGNIDRLKIYTSLTFIMPLLEELEEDPAFIEESIKILKVLYIFLVRRSIVGLKTTKDNTIFPRLWEDIKSQDNRAEAIKNVFKDKKLFVEDTQLQDRFLSLNLYDHPQKRFILEEIDKYLCKMRNHGEMPDYETLDSTEHILPQSFDTNNKWKNYLEEEYRQNPQYSEILSNRIGTIGNLLLVGSPRNSSLQDDTFPDKIERYAENSGLSTHLLENWSDQRWNVETIEARSKELAKVAAKVWPWE